MTAPVPRIRYTCPTCGTVFFDTAKRQRIYCSRKCHNEARSQTRRQVTHICAYCGKSFTAVDASKWTTFIAQRFCSQRCQGKGVAQEKGLHVRKKTTFTCQNCNKTFTRMARADRAYLYCSRPCFWSHHRGENHHCWQGGTDRYYGPNWKSQRRRALRRDKRICQTCGMSEHRMNVHHIIPRSEFDHDWKSMNALSNLVTLCSACHAKIHNCQDRLPSVK